MKQSLSELYFNKCAFDEKKSEQDANLFYRFGANKKYSRKFAYISGQSDFSIKRKSLDAKVADLIKACEDAFLRDSNVQTALTALAKELTDDQA